MSECKEGCCPYAGRSAAILATAEKHLEYAVAIVGQHNTRRAEEISLFLVDVRLALADHEDRAALAASPKDHNGATGEVRTFPAPGTDEGPSHGHPRSRPTHCYECSPDFGCFNGRQPCSKQPVSVSGERSLTDADLRYPSELRDENDERVDTLIDCVFRSGCRSREQCTVECRCCGFDSGGRSGEKK